MALYSGECECSAECEYSGICHALLTPGSLQLSASEPGRSARLPRLRDRTRVQMQVSGRPMRRNLHESASPPARSTQNLNENTFLSVQTGFAEKGEPLGIVNALRLGREYSRNCEYSWEGEYTLGSVNALRSVNTLGSVKLC